jgi:glucan phosphoethanolaminetransferase (alkaline phosphatase superfamily)
MSGNTRSGAWHDTLAGYALRAATAAALVIDAVVHLQDAHFYDANTGSLLDQGQLFRIQAVAAIIVAVAVLVWPRWPSWLLAFLVAASACAAVVTYSYVDIGPIAGLPSMYEHSWGPPGKVLSAWAEGAAALLALTGLIRALAQRRAASGRRDATASLAAAGHGTSG